MCGLPVLCAVKSGIRLDAGTECLKTVATYSIDTNNPCRCREIIDTVVADKCPIAGFTDDDASFHLIGGNAWNEFVCPNVS